MKYFYIFLLAGLAACDPRLPEEKLPTLHFDRDEYLDRTIEKLSLGMDESSTIDDLIRLGHHLSQQGWPAPAGRWSILAVKSSQQSDALCTLLGRYFFNVGQYRLAQEYAAIANRLGDVSVEYYQLQAELATYHKKYEQALDYVNRAILINQSDYYLYRTKANIYLTIGDTISGIEFLTRGLELQPRLVDMGTQLSQLYLDQGQTGKALSQIRQMQTYHPDNQDLLWQEAQCYIGTGDNDKARQVLRTAIGQDSSMYQLQTKLADMYLEIGKLDSAIILSENILNHDSSSIDEHLRLGEIYDRKNLLNKSLEAYRQALSMDSTSDIAAEGETKVLRKLAYLRALRETKEQLPSLEILTPKKN